MTAASGLQNFVTACNCCFSARLLMLKRAPTISCQRLSSSMAAAMYTDELPTVEVGPGRVRLAVHVLDLAKAAEAALADADSAASAVAKLAAAAVTDAASGAAPTDAEQLAAQGVAPRGTVFQSFSNRHPDSWLPVPQLLVMAQCILGTKCTPASWQQRMSKLGSRPAEAEEQRLFRAFQLLPAAKGSALISTEAFADFLCNHPGQRGVIVPLASREPAKLLGAWLMGRCKRPALGDADTPPAAAAGAAPAGNCMHTARCVTVVLAAQPAAENIRHDHTADCLRIYTGRAFPANILGFRVKA